MRKANRYGVTHLALMLGLAALIGLPTALAQDNTMYKWTDENGVVHFSDKAPQGQDIQPQQLPESYKPGSVSPLPAADAEADESPVSAAQQRRDEIAASAEEGRAQQRQMDSQCVLWRAELERLEPNRRVFFTNDQGETERMDDQVRADRVDKLRELIGENCG